jgi:acyl carrier protein
MQTEELLNTLLHDKFGVPQEEISSEQTFEDLGIDSLIIVELALVLRKQLGVQLDDDELYPELTLSESARLLDEKAGAAA